jgi:phosphoribosylaminoimidazole carboxylase
VRTVNSLDRPCLYVCRMAYDGKGNAVVETAAELDTAVASLGGFSQGLYAEKWVPYIMV